MSSGFRDDDLAPHLEDYFRCGAAQEDMEATTMFVRINTQHAVNMDNVTELYLTHSAGLGCSRTAIIINFTADTPLTIYDDMEGYERLKMWIEQLPRLSRQPFSIESLDAIMHYDGSRCSDVTCPCHEEV